MHYITGSVGSAFVSIYHIRIKTYKYFLSRCHKVNVYVIKSDVALCRATATWEEVKVLAHLKNHNGNHEALTLLLIALPAVLNQETTRT
jgi:hypothetical protein